MIARRFGLIGFGLRLSLCVLAVYSDDCSDFMDCHRGVIIAGILALLAIVTIIVVLYFLWPVSSEERGVGGALRGTALTCEGVEVAEVIGGLFESAAAGEVVELGRDWLHY